MRRTFFLEEDILGWHRRVLRVVAKEIDRDLKCRKKKKKRES
jgi:hypothetical protein